jgi:ubiquinone biosynthesis O-methyltransferase
MLQRPFLRLKKFTCVSLKNRFSLIHIDKKCEVPLIYKVYRLKFDKEYCTKNQLENTLTTISKDEVVKFGKLSHNWWNPRGEMKLLHLMNPTRVAYIRRHMCELFRRSQNVARPLTGLRIVDVGCGAGLLSESLARLGGSVLGIDASEENIDTATFHAKNDPLFLDQNSGELCLSYRCTTPEKLLEVESSLFDAVCCLEVVEHVDNVPTFISSLCTLVKPGGALFLSTINRTTLSFLLTIVGAEYLCNWVPRGTHDWTKYLTPEEIIMLLRQQKDSNMHVVNVTGLRYNPFRMSWHETTDLTVNYILCAVKQKNNQSNIK